MDVLAELQKRFLSEVAKSSLRESFFLTGGTALSAFFLEHRLSEDLDFLTEEPERVQHVLCGATSRPKGPISPRFSFDKPQ